MMNTVLETPSSKRDSNWENNFLNAFVEADLYLRSDEPFQGPDGFSYMDVSTTDEGYQKLKLEDFISWCAHAGVGIVVNLKSNKTPDYVFNYGMIWNYLLRRKFLNPDIEDLDHGSEAILVHKIVEGFLPKYVRENISEFLTLNKINEVKIGLISRGDNTPYELLWHFSDNKALSEKDSKTLLESIAWFLPLDYRVALTVADDPGLHLEEL